MDTEQPDWVGMCEYLEIPPPNPNYSHKEEVIGKVTEIRDYFKSKYKDNYMDAFIDYLGQLNATPKNGTRLDQVLRSVKMNKLASKILGDISKL